MRLLCTALTWLLLLFCAATTHADIYKFVDAEGVVHFTNVPPTKQYKLYRREHLQRDNNQSSAEIPASLIEIVRDCSARYRVEEALVHAVIKAESNYNPSAVSRKGALGLMQLMPETARLLKVSDPFDVEDNIRGGSRYLRQMLDEFNGNVDYAIAAYNAGPNAVHRHGGIPPYAETQSYVKRVKQYLHNFRQNSAWL